MQDEADRGSGRRSGRSRAARRAREDGAAPADDVLARLGIKAQVEEPWLEPVEDEDPATTQLPRTVVPPRDRDARPPAAPPVPPVPPAQQGLPAPPAPPRPLPPARPATPPPPSAQPAPPPAPPARVGNPPPSPRIPPSARAGNPPPPPSPRHAPPPAPSARAENPSARPAPPGRSGTPPADAGNPPARAAAPPARTPPASPPPASDDSEHQAERRAERTRRIDASLTRLTAAHTADPEPEAEDPPPTRRAGRRVEHAPSRGLLTARVGAALVAALVFLGVAGSWGATRWMDSTVRTVSALDPTTGVIGADAQAGDENLLLLGTASGTSGTAAGSGDRADTLMLTHVPADGSRVVAVSLPLGLEINRPPCERWDAAAATYLGDTVSAETRTPLATAYRVGGPRCLVRTVQQLSGIAVTRFVALDLPGLGGMVDALGGVDLCLERPVTAGGATVPAGPSRVDGAQAALVAQTPDPAQVAHQQRLLAATFGEALSSSTLLSPTATRDFAAALGRSMLADDASVQDLLRLTSALGEPEGTSLVPLPVGAVPNTRGNLELRGSEASALFKAMREHGPLPELTTPVATASGPEPADVIVNVLNAADRTGLAGEVGGSLRTLGFGVGEVGNAAEPSADTLLRFSPDRADAAELLGRVIPAARLVQDPAGNGTLQLVLGTSFDRVVRAPVTSAPENGAVGPSVSCP